MILNQNLEAEIARVVSLLEKGAKGLLSFQQDDGFVRDSGDGVLGLTSSHRTMVALCEATRILRDEGDYLAPVVKQCTNAANALWAELYEPALANDSDDVVSERLRESLDNGVNDFTDAHLVGALGYAQSPHLAVNINSASAARRLRKRLAANARSALTKNSIGKLRSSDTGHDFVSLWQMRAIDLSTHLDGVSPFAAGPKVGRRVRDNILRQLGWYTADVGARFDPGELAFALPLLQRFSPDEMRPLAQRCIDVMAESQTADGAWPGCRIISTGIAEKSPALLHITSYEVGLTLATWLDQRRSTEVRDPSSSAVADRALEVLRKTFRLAETSFTDEEWEGAGPAKWGKPSRQGWSNDRTRGQGLVESWVTAVVVTFLARYYDVLRAELQQAILARYEVEDFYYLRPLSSWPDYSRTFGPATDPPAVKQTLDLYISDPTDDGKISEALESKMLAPVVSSANKRPRQNSLSLLLPGPAGSRKTSLVRALARSMQWPLLTVSPPTFLVDGLNGLEQRAADVFGDLQRLRRVVVLFDECEELFRKRGSVTSGTPDPRAEAPVSASTRTAGAFITSGMLPRLQALHDEAWSIFALAFNGTLDDLDTAATRPGRFDFTLALNYPTKDAQIRYLEKEFVKRGLDPKATLYKHAREAIEKYAKEDDKDGIGIPWAVLNELILYCVRAPQVTRSDLSDLLRSLDQTRPPSLTG